MRWLADFVYLMVGLWYLPIAIFQAVFHRKNRRGWGERFGYVPRFDAARPRVWIHAVSLGEINATRTLVNELSARRPDIDFVFSTTTDTGFARGVELYGARRVFRFPLDFSPVIARTMRRIAPSLIVLMELEVWFNLVTMAKERGVPVVVVNGRLTAKSARRFGYLGGIGRTMFDALEWVGAQDEAIAARFVNAGVRPERVETMGSLKWDTATVTDHIAGAGELAAALGIDGRRPLWVCGSTGEGEEAILLEAYKTVIQNWPRLARRLPENPGDMTGGTLSPILAIIPRKPERFAEVAALMVRAGFRCVRRTEHPDGSARAPLSAGEVLLGDTMGELRKFYALASVVFVGRSLVPWGGSDPMEVAALGKCIVLGPHTENFAQPVALLKAEQAIRIVERAESLPSLVGSLLAEPRSAQRIGRAARKVVLRQQGATGRTVERLLTRLPPA